MSTKTERIEVFVPAMALQHPANGPEMTLGDKIRAALHRYHKHGNFDDLAQFEPNKPMTQIIVRYTELETKPQLGYRVMATVN